MKKAIISFLFIFMAVNAIASDVIIDKENCTITKDGKIYKLYGIVKIVDHFEDLRVKIVDHFEDADGKKWYFDSVLSE